MCGEETLEIIDLAVKPKQIYDFKTTIFRGSKDLKKNVARNYQLTLNSTIPNMMKPPKQPY